jgi:DNA adenine methylase
VPKPEEIETPGEVKAAKPFLKWAGGKRLLLGEIRARTPLSYGTYFEPFVGAGAVFLSIPNSVNRHVSDSNSQLIEVYEVIRDSVEELISELKRHQNTRDYFLQVRAWDRESSFSSLSPVQRAARFIYLNKTCFNGLFRVNASGHFNVPFGNYKKPEIVGEQNLRTVSSLLANRGLVTISQGDYRKTTAHVRKGDFVYLDPPYDPLSSTSSFVSYQSGGFTREDQEALRDEVLRLTAIGASVLLSNSDTPFIRALYSDKRRFKVEHIQVSRAISANASSRGKVGEVLVSNIVPRGGALSGEIH